MKRNLPAGVSLQVFLRDKLYFESKGKWLYPLFELEDAIKIHPIEISEAEILDKVIGKAAALLLVYFGAVKIHGVLMSDLAINVFKQYSLPYSFNKHVPKIKCKTKELLQDIHNPETAYRILSERANQ